MGKDHSTTPPKNKSTSNKITQTYFDSSEEIQDFKMSSNILAAIEKLKGRENYSSWKFSMQNYLELEDLAKCIDGTETDAKKNARAKSVEFEH